MSTTGTGFIAFIFGLGIATWIYTKAMRQTGNNTKSSLIVAGVVGLIAAFVIYTVFKLFLR